MIGEAETAKASRTKTLVYNTPLYAITTQHSTTLLGPSILGLKIGNPKLRPFYD